MPGYVFKRLLIAIITLFILSLLISIFIYFARFPGPINTIDLTTLSPAEIEEELANLPQSPYQHYPSFPEYYSRWIGGIFTGDFGESIMLASYYAE